MDSLDNTEKTKTKSWIKIVLNGIIFLFLLIVFTFGWALLGAATGIIKMCSTAPDWWIAMWLVLLPIGIIYTDYKISKYLINKIFVRTKN